ncbi:WYL domain-containing protein [Cetobacterium somerae]
MREKIKEDEIHFKLLTGEIGNRIFSYFSNKEVEKLNIKTNKGDIIQFNLNKINSELYDTVLKEHNVQVESEFFRDIFFKYLDTPRYLREQILFNTTFLAIDEALKENKKLNIKYNNEIRSIHPYFIKIAPGEDCSYIFCFCEKNNAYRNYRISNIQNISISKNSLTKFDIEYIEAIDKNFDPFLSYGKKVIVKLTLEGELLFKRAILNRPLLLEKTNDLWIFQCTNKLAKVYFPQFLAEAEIIEPKELREWFNINLKKAYKIYE